MQKSLALRTTDGTIHNHKMAVVSWVCDRTAVSYIQISGVFSRRGQRLITIRTSGGVEDQRRLSEFHDKLLSALERLDVQITIYLDVKTLPRDLVEVDLTTSLVYLLVNF